MKVLQWILIFNVVCLAWVFFRAQSINTAFEILGRLFATGGKPGGATLLLVTVVVLSVASQFVPSRIPEKVELWFGRLAPLIQVGALAISLVMIDALGPEGIAPFIYFQF